MAPPVYLIGHHPPLDHIDQLFPTLPAAEDYLLHQLVYNLDRVHDHDCDSSTTTCTLGSTAEACGSSAARRDIGAGALAPPAVSRSLRGFELYQGYGYASPVSPSPRSDHAPRMLDDGGVLLVDGNGGISDRVLWLRSMVPRSRIELYRRPSYAIHGPPPPYFKATLNAVVAVDCDPVHEHDVKPHLHKGAPGPSVGAVDGSSIGTLAGAAACGLSHDSVSLCACACDAPRESTAPRADGPRIDDHATRSCVPPCLPRLVPPRLAQTPARQLRLRRPSPVASPAWPTTQANCSPKLDPTVPLYLIRRLRLSLRRHRLPPHRVSP